MSAFSYQMTRDLWIIWLFVIIAALQVVLSVVKSSCLDSCSWCGRCQCDGSAVKILSVLVCLSGNKEGDQVFIVYYSCIWIAGCRIGTGQQSFSLPTCQLRSWKRWIKACEVLRFVILALAIPWLCSSMCKSSVIEDRNDTQ